MDKIIHIKIFQTGLTSGAYNINFHKDKNMLEWFLSIIYCVDDSKDKSLEIYTDESGYP